MQSLIPAILTCTLIITVATSGASADQPIPQNPARQEKALRDLLEWNRRTLGGAYEKVGKKDAKWDKPAREALEAAARVAGRAIDPAASWADILGPAGRAIDAGCDDPLILFLHADSCRIPDRPEPAELDRRWSAAASAMERSNYPPLRRGLALFGAGMARAKKQDPTPSDRDEAARHFGKVLALLPSGASKEDSNIEAEQEWFLLARDLVAGLRSVGGDLKSALSRVDGALAKAAGWRANRLQIKAYWLIMEGWEIRGGGLASSVTEDANRRFHEKNIEASKVLMQAWAIDPKNYRTPTMMISVVLTLGGERPDMEVWFRRAMELKDDNVVACVAKMSYVDPKWYGSREEMMEFGEACKATRNWRGGITVIAASVHIRWAMQLEGAEQNKYLESPEVWENGRAIYEEYLSHYTEDHAIRSDFAGFAYFCNRRDEAARQFNILGDRLVGSKPYPLEQLKRFKASLDDETKRREQAKGQNAASAQPKVPVGSPK